MHVALDATPLLLSSGGLARYTVELCRALAGEYPEDRLTLFSDQPVGVPEALQGLASVGAGPRNWLERRWWLYGLSRRLRLADCDVFHGVNFEVPYWRRLPAVMTLHDLSPWKDPGWQSEAGRIRRRAAWALRLDLADMVIVPSEAVRLEAIARFGLQPCRVVAIPHAAAPEFRPSRPANPPARPYFLFVGTLEPRKNIPRLLDAWREVARVDAVDLWIAGRRRGDGPVLQPEPGLRLLGEVAEANLPGLYSGAVACVYPSLYEGFGLPVLEAMQCGCPVITSSDPAITEVAGGACLQVDATDGRALAAAMRAMLDPAIRETWKNRGLRRAAGFRWADTARRTHAVYEEAQRRFHA